MLAAGGWLGGHLTYALGVGVDTTAFESGPDEWTAIGHLADLTVDQPAAVTTDGGVQLLVVRRAGDHVEVLEDRCTHRGGPLSDGELSGDGNCITCPWHGSTFRVATGEVVKGPATRPQPAYEARVVDGAVEVKRDEVRSLRSAWPAARRLQERTKRCRTRPRAPPRAAAAPLRRRAVPPLALPALLAHWT